MRLKRRDLCPQLLPIFCNSPTPLHTSQHVHPSIHPHTRVATDLKVFTTPPPIQLSFYSFPAALGDLVLLITPVIVVKAHLKPTPSDICLLFSAALWCFVAFVSIGCCLPVLCYAPHPHTALYHRNHKTLPPNEAQSFDRAPAQGAGDYSQ